MNVWCWEIVDQPSYWRREYTHTYTFPPQNYLLTSQGTKALCICKSIAYLRNYGLISSTCIPINFQPEIRKANDVFLRFPSCLCSWRGVHQSNAVLEGLDQARREARYRASVVLERILQLSAVVTMSRLARLLPDYGNSFWKLDLEIVSSFLPVIL